MGNLPPNLQATHPYLYCMAHWLRRMPCQDYHSFPGNFIIIGTGSCGGVTVQVCLLPKSRISPHTKPWRRREIIKTQRAKGNTIVPILPRLTQANTSPPSDVSIPSHQEQDCTLGHKQRRQSWFLCLHGEVTTSRLSRVRHGWLEEAQSSPEGVIGYVGRIW